MTSGGAYYAVLRTTSLLHAAALPGLNIPTHCAVLEAYFSAYLGHLPWRPFQRGHQGEPLLRPHCFLAGRLTWYCLGDCNALTGTMFINVKYHDHVYQHLGYFNQALKYGTVYQGFQRGLGLL